MVGRLHSGNHMRGVDIGPLMREELLLEFDAHRQLWDATPTAIVSATTNPCV